MMNKLTPALLLVGFATAAIAQQPAAPPVPRTGAPAQRRLPQDREVARPGFPSFEAADKNKDGHISRQEASAIQGLDFAAADTNNSSSLDLMEYMAAVARQSASPRG